MKNFHKLAMLALSLALVIGLVACPNKTEPKPEPEPTPGPGPVVPTPEPYTILDAGTDGTGTAGTEATYVTFGEWPQSVLPEGTTVTVDETVSKTVGFFTYYKGSDENWYVKQEEKASESGKRYSDGSVVKRMSENSTRYFKVEPIKWRVLEEAEGKKFLLAENGLMALPYYDNVKYRTIGDKDICPNNYMHSKIRAFLNGYKYQLGDADNSDYENKGFLQTAFTSEAQAKIATTTVDNSVASTLYSPNRSVCDNTSDKVFLLSAKETITATYGFSTSTTYPDKPRIRKPTDFALATGAYNFGFGGKNGCFWWLRSPENDNLYHARYIDVVGYVFFHEIILTFGAVVPALWVTQ